MPGGAEVTNVFASSGAFGRMTVEQIIESASGEGVRRIELASGTRHDSGSELVSTLEAGVRQGYAFRVHNYFPVPEVPFVLNLASADSTNLERSLSHVRTSIDLAATIDSPYYSVHCGFCIDPSPQDLGRELHGRKIPLDQALGVFVESVQDLADYASERGVGLLLENNVLSALNAGKVQLLGVRAEELENLFERINRPNVGLLLDVGHLKVSAVTLDFDVKSAAARLAPLVRCCHLSDNDGTEDSNQVIASDSWFWEPLLGNLQSSPDWVLEAYNLQMQTIAEQITLIEARVS